MRPVLFTPVFAKHAGERCGGVHIHVVELGELESVELAAHLLSIVYRMALDRFAWLPPTDGHFFIDLLCGTDQVRQTIDADADPRPILDRWRADSKAFEDFRADVPLD